MDKRTKILLIVLVALLVMAGGFYAYMFMTAEETVTAVAPPPAPVKKAPQKKAKAAKEAAPAIEEQAEKPEPGAAQQTEAEKKAEPGPAAEQKVAEKSEKAKAGAEKQAKAGKMAEGKPAVKSEVAEKAGKPKPAEPKAEAEKKTEGKPTVKKKGPAKPAPCEPVLVAAVKGKKVEFKTPAELVDKSGMDEKALKEFSTKNLDAAKKKVEKIKKAKGSAAEMDCAKKELDLAGQLAKFVKDKFAAKPEKMVYTYSSLDKRDPFMSPMEIPRVYPPVPKNAPPLQRVPSEQLKVQGLMWNERGFRALVTTPDDRGYTVKVGDTVGNKRGKVIRITEKRVYIEERIPDIFGDIEVRNIVLKLHKEAE